MNTRTVLAAAATAAMMAMTVSLFAAEQGSAGAAPKSEPIYGYGMMTNQERNEYREKMRNAPGSEARQKVRDDHRKVMEGRAKERGVTLPEPRGSGPGAGPGPRGEGKGPGYGPGGGKGPGYGPGGQGKGTGPGYGPGAGMGPGAGKGPGYGPGPRAECPAGQDCPGPGAGKGPGYGPGAQK